MGQGTDECPLVLFADDDEMQRFLCTEALDEAGFRVHAVCDGAEAVKEAQRLRPDIILLDVMMPVMDGFTACERIRNNPACDDIPVIVATADDDIDSIERAYNVGATDFMAKPINWTILCQRLRYVIRASTAFNELRASQARLAEAQRIARLGSWEWNPQDERFSCSEEAARIFGLAPDGVSLGHANFISRIHPEDRDRIELVLHRALRTGRTFDTDCRILVPDSTERIITIKADAETSTDLQSTYLKGTFQDITERKQMEANMHHMAHHDPLTNLPNRRLLRERLEQVMAQAQREDGVVSILYLDIDRFKEVNDTLGHAVGDQLLLSVSQRINDVIGDGDTVARLGGDEFAILLVRSKHSDDVTELTARLLQTIGEPFNIRGHDVVTSTSIGISTFPKDSDDPDQLMVNADIALYSAKSDGRGDVRIFEASMLKRLSERRALEADLRRGLEKGWFELYYQPQVDVESNEVVGVEALLRLNHPTRGLVTPAEFIPLAEETGLIVPIGEWVLQTACAQAKAWQSTSMQKLRVSVNLSSVQFTKTDILGTVKTAINLAGLEPSLLELEVTESVLLDDTANTLEKLESLRDLGVQIALDDFGTGYSALSYLVTYPFDRIKIDRSFVQEADTDREAEAIVRAILSLGDGLRMSTTAEGVETLSQLRFCQGLGCDEVQGYYFGRPVPAKQLMDEVMQIRETAA